MPKAKPAFTPAPRPFNEWQVAARLGRGVEWFRQHRGRLEGAGFPRKDALLDAWDSKAIEAWFDRRAGLIDDSAPESDSDPFLARVEGAAHGRADA